ncbi:MAG: hypothetical protein KDD02_17840 [Phaeodactylibacter sp.]|nr:hypothetical protein [Phaeodactylibacter sp.]MCB9302468.1 hypothetical protein [Lewinellaceae bacterium]
MIATSLAIQYLATTVFLLILFITFRKVALSLLKVSFFLGLYIIGIPALYHWPQLRASWETDLAAGMAIPFAVIVLAAMLFALVAYFVDRYFDKAQPDHFKGDKLFFRYGRRIFHTIVPIGLEEGFTQQDAEDLEERLGDYLWDHIHEQFANREDIAAKRIYIRDLGWRGRKGDRQRPTEKAFLRVTFQTPRKAKLSYFIHLNHLGHQLLAHHYAYLQGRHFWHHVLVFIASAPFHVWFWGYRWVMGRYSIQSRLNRYFAPSSYGLIDLETCFESIHFNLMSATLRFAKVYGLMAEELEKIILYNLSNSKHIPFGRLPRILSRLRPGQAGIGR